MKTITIAGTIGKDAVLRRTQSGDPVTGFSVAVDDGFGEQKSTMWFDVSLWGKRGDALVKHLSKGTKVTVSGDLGIRQHDGKTYLTVRANDITLQGGGKQSGDQGMYDREPSSRSTADAMDDALPF